MIAAGDRDPGPVDPLLDLVARASCPVAFAPPGYRRATPIRCVVVGHDGSVEADGALALALEIADRADIAVVRVVRPGPVPGHPGRVDGSPGTPAYDHADAQLRALAEPHGIRHAVTVGDPASALARVSRTADLLCVGVGAHSETPGGTLDGLLRCLTTPLLMVPLARGPAGVGPPLERRRPE